MIQRLRLAFILLLSKKYPLARPIEAFHQIVNPLPEGVKVSRILRKAGRMRDVIIVGTQWGDEGKGKIVDWLAERAQIVVRFQGGHNAGHTLVIDGKTFKLSLLPSGIVRKQTLSLIGNGVVVDPFHLLQEITLLREQGIEITPERLRISPQAVLILPLHSALDQRRERSAGKDSKIGTTGRGIGPAYEDKIGRRAIRVGDLLDLELLYSRIEVLLQHHNALAKGLGFEPYDQERLYQKLAALADPIAPFIAPVMPFLERAQRQGGSVMYEGAQGLMLDVDQGTYPFVTSSNTLAANAAIGSGWGRARHAYALGITKAYTTRVGEGPFPTELFDVDGQRLGERGHEFGVVTGRKRRCGWFDAVMVRQAIKASGVDGIALTKLDVLDGFKRLKISVGYDLDGRRLEDFPSSPSEQARLKPVYEELPGWSEPIKGLRDQSQLPQNARAYLKRLETLIEAPVVVLSTSPKREDSILLEGVF